MRSLATLLNRYTIATSNWSADNQTMGLELMQDHQRYLLEEYFDNERQYSVTTVGSQTLTLSAGLASGATTGTLSTAWPYASGTQGVVFTNTNSDVRQVYFTYNSTAISWSLGLGSATTSTSIQTQGFQKYLIPPQISKVTNAYITVGELRFPVIPIHTRGEWDRLNFLPYNTDIPQYMYIYNGSLEIYPVPSTTGNVLTFNYKSRVADFSTNYLFSSTSGAAYVAGQETAYDYENGTVTGTTGSYSITGSGTSWNTTGKFPLNTDISAFNLGIVIPQPYGDGLMYLIREFTSDTALQLMLPLQLAPNISGSAYSIAQYPILSEDFHDMIWMGAAMEYFSTIFPDKNRYEQLEKQYDVRRDRLAAYAGTKQVNYNLGERPQWLNPNNYYYPAQSQSEA